jgi:hypothetical protein
LLREHLFLCKKWEKAVMEAPFATPQCLCVTVPDGTPRRWLAACYQVTPLVEQVGTATALLDLGTCNTAEAWQVGARLLARLRRHDVIAQAALAPNGTLAHLAALQSSPRQPLTVLRGGDTAELLASTPVALLGQLHPAGAFSPELLARLTAYGLSTLRHIARLSDATLGHQFGPAGLRLARLARGEALQALRPTPAPRCHTLALRIPAEAFPLAQVTARLPVLMARLKAWLTWTGYAVGEVRLRLGWASGGEDLARRLLDAPTSDAGLLAREAKRLLTRITAARRATSADLVSACQLTVARPAVAIPDQAVLWTLPAPCHHAARQVAAVLAARHHMPQVFQLSPIRPAAIFPEDRFTLIPYDAPAKAQPVGAPRRGAVGDWDEVPQRLHWW